MPITINGSGTLTGLSAGGLPDGVITADEMASGVLGLRGISVFTTTGTSNWTAPAGVTTVKVTVIGGGGSGGGNSANANNGGGSAGLAIGVVSVTPGTSYTVTVGAASTINTAGGTLPVGGTSSFGTLISATGGQGGSGGTASNIPGTGGTASGGSLNLSGSTGSSAGASIGLGLPVWGQGGASPVGYGSGSTANSGNQGRPGIVIVEW